MPLRTSTRDAVTAPGRPVTRPIPGPGPSGPAIPRSGPSGPAHRADRHRRPGPGGAPSAPGGPSTRRAPAPRTPGSPAGATPPAGLAIAPLAGLPPRARDPTQRPQDLVDDDGFERPKGDAVELQVAPGQGVVGGADDQRDGSRDQVHRVAEVDPVLDPDPRPSTAIMP